jgi:hypothetical protein
MAGQDDSVSEAISKAAFAQHRHLAALALEWFKGKDL